MYLFDKNILFLLECGIKLQNNGEKMTCISSITNNFWTTECGQSLERGLASIIQAVDDLGLNILRWQPAFTGENKEALERLMGRVSNDRAIALDLSELLESPDADVNHLNFCINRVKAELSSCNEEAQQFLQGLNDWDTAGDKTEAVARIKDAFISGTDCLDLSDLELTFLPPQIGNLTNLTQLDLSNNELSKLPSEIGKLTNLTQLGLSDNELSKLPSEIGKLINLTHLDLFYNKLSELPSQIGNLTNLIQLGLSDNELSKLPSEIGKLTNLTHLDLGNNKLSELPSEINNLNRLIELDYSRNQLTEAPNITLPNLTSHEDFDNPYISNY
jgi:Leucine-rich repeat (LRR) protein